MITRCRRGGRFVVALAGAVLLAMVPPAGARQDEVRECVEHGGIYYEDGRCETAAETPAHACHRRGGEWIGGGRCQIRVSEQQQIDACKKAGGVIMQAGNCYGPPPRR
jgi:hypothetical protein